MIRAMFPVLLDGTAQVWGADPKLMELAFGRAIFERYGHYAADAQTIAAMLEDALADMHDRAATFAGQRARGDDLPARSTWRGSGDHERDRRAHRGRSYR